jgi:hypothetical protein
MGRCCLVHLYIVCSPGISFSFSLLCGCSICTLSVLE